MDKTKIFLKAKESDEYIPTGRCGWFPSGTLWYTRPDRPANFTPPIMNRWSVRRNVELGIIKIEGFVPSGVLTQEWLDKNNKDGKIIVYRTNIKE